MITKSKLFIYNNFLDHIKIFLSCLINNNNNNFLNKIKNQISNKILLTAQARVGIFYISKYLVSKNFEKFYISPYTNIEVIEAIKFSGGKINFIDLNYENGYPKNIDNLMLNKNEKRCLILTHLYSDHNNLKKVFDKLKNRDENFKIIEDAAIVFGSKYDKKYLGTLFDFGVFSFGKLKNLSLIFGGAIYYKDENFENYYKEIEKNNLVDFPKTIFIKELLFSLLVYLSSLNIFNFFFSKILNLPTYKSKKHFFSKIQYKSLFPEINQNIPKNYFFKFPYFISNFALKKLNYVEEEINIRYKKAKYYYENLKKFDSIYIPMVIETESKYNSYIEFPFILRKESKKNLLIFLSKKSIFLRLHWYLNNEIFYDFKKLTLPNDCNLVQDNTVVLPCGPHITRKYQDFILKNIKKYFEINKLT